MRKYKNKILTALVISVILMLAFFYGGSVPSVENSQINKKVNTSQGVTADDEIMQGNPTDIYTPVNEKMEKTVKENTTIEDEYKNESANEPIDFENTKAADNELTCTLSVRCDTILNNIDLLGKEKAAIVPKDGIIYPEKTVVFYEGESVFNVLRRELKQSKIHLEFVNIPVYNSAYIEGIGNIYEFDCGELSGWMYKVNDYFPNYGSSRCELKDKDRIEWVYTCDLGKDIGGHYSARNGR